MGVLLVLQLRKGVPFVAHLANERRQIVCTVELAWRYLPDKKVSRGKKVNLIFPHGGGKGEIHLFYVCRK